MPPEPLGGERCMQVVADLLGLTMHFVAAYAISTILTGCLYRKTAHVSMYGCKSGYSRSADIISSLLHC